MTNVRDRSPRPPGKGGCPPTESVTLPVAEEVTLLVTLTESRAVRLVPNI